MEINVNVNCPKCGSKNTYVYGTDKKEFNHDGTGYVLRDYRCNDCQKYFENHIQFEYKITSQTIKQ